MKLIIALALCAVAAFALPVSFAPINELLIFEPPCNKTNRTGRLHHPSPLRRAKGRYQHCCGEETRRAATG